MRITIVARKVYQVKRTIKMVSSISLFLIIIFSMGANNVAAPKTSIDFRHLVEEIDENLLREHVMALTSFPSKDEPTRFTGYEGFYIAANYIIDRLKEFGYKPELENFTITVPLDDGAEIQILQGGPDLKIKAYPLMPNTVNPGITPPEGVVGLLVDGGNGELYNFDGKEVDGSIVLIDYDSRWFWKNAVMLGAKAIIFIEPEKSTLEDSLQKIMKIPVGIPRVMIKREAGLRLRELLKEGNQITVRLKSRMHWENVIVSNIVVSKIGAERPQEQIVVAASYDSYSPVPSISPGATEALNVATLLEIARILADEDITLVRTVKMVFLAGHGQGLWGAREFVDKHFYEIGTRIKLFIALDLAYDSKDLSIYARGSTYKYRAAVDPSRFSYVNDRIVSYSKELSTQTGREYTMFSGIYPSVPLIEPHVLLLDSDPFTLAGGAGVTFHTTNSLRERQMTPSDRPEFIDFSNVIPQAELILASIYGLANEYRFSISGTPTRLAADEGFATINGYVGLYNLTTAWYDPFPHPDSIIHVQWRAAPLTEQQAVEFSTREPPTIDFFVKPSSDASFVVKGVKPFTEVRLEAYILDREKGGIIYATDFGVYGLGRGYPSAPKGAWQTPVAAETTIWLPVFKCGSFVLLNIVDPTTTSAVPFAVLNYNFLSHSWNLKHSEAHAQREAVVFVPPNQPVEFILQVGGEGGTQRIPLAVLANITEDNPVGSGYVVSVGEMIFFKVTPYQIAKQMWLLTESRAGITSAYHVYSVRIADFHPGGTEALRKAEKALKEKIYSSAISYSMRCWSLERSAYDAAMKLIIDVILTVVFFFLLMAPFSFLMQKFLFPRLTGFKRLGSFGAIFFAATLFLWTFHPGFHVAFNVTTIILSAAIVVLAVAVVIWVTQETTGAAKAYQASILGLHYSDFSRTAATVLAINLGIENMRKRKLRTILSFASVILVVTGLIALTSSSFYTLMIMADYEATLPYEGILLHDPLYSPQAEEMKQVLEGLYKINGIVSPRTWIVRREGFSLDGNVKIEGIFGLTTQEKELLPVDKTLIKGRWFMEEDLNVAIISKTVADELGVDVGDVVNLLGSKLTIIGIFDPTAWSVLNDLDQVQFVPMIVEQQTLIPLSPDRAIIVPFEFVLKQFNYFPVSIAVKIYDPEIIFESARKLSLQTIRISVYAGVNNILRHYQPYTFYGVSGVRLVIVPLIIGGLTILNVMLAGVYERRREILILNSLGVSPKHILGLFLAESVLYAIIGTMFGYFSAVVAIAFLDAFNLIPAGVAVNYASTFVIITIGIAMAMCFPSTLYPAIKASKLATPSLRRKWRFETKPRGDLWVIPFPLTFEQIEGLAALVYMGEYVRSSAAVYEVFAANPETISLKYEEERATLSFETRLAPYELGVEEHVEIACLVRDGRTRFEVVLKRMSGDRSMWILANYPFIDRLRKQFLIWRALPQEDKDHYFKQAHEIFGLNES